MQSMQRGTGCVANPTSSLTQPCQGIRGTEKDGLSPHTQGSLHPAVNGYRCQLVGCDPASRDVGLVSCLL